MVARPYTPDLYTHIYYVDTNPLHKLKKEIKMGLKNFIAKLLRIHDTRGLCINCKWGTNPYAEDNPEGYFCEFHRIATKNWTQETSFGCVAYTPTPVTAVTN